MHDSDDGLSPVPTQTAAAQSTWTTGRVAVLCFVAIVILASGFVRFYRLSTPSGYIFDEVYYAKDAETIIKGDIGPRKDYHWMPGNEVSWPHAEYGKMAIALGILAFGNNEFGWRFVPALAGLALLLCIYPIARRLGLSREWSLAALVLAAVDFLGIAQSRIATLDIFVGLWTVVTVLLTLRYTQTGRRWYWLVLAGVTAGLAIGSKWSGVWAILAALVLLVLFRRHEALGDLRGPPSGGRRIARAARSSLLPIACLLILPVAIYFASYGLYFNAGHTLKDWWDLQQQMWTFNTNLHATHTYASAAETWMLDIRPVWYYFKTIGGAYHGVIAMGSPFLWWVSALALVALPIMAIVDRNRALVLPSLVVALLYFFWFAFGRTSFLYYMTPVAPFMAILVAAALARLARRPPRLTPYGQPVAEDSPPPRLLWSAGGGISAIGGDQDTDYGERGARRRRQARDHHPNDVLQALAAFAGSAAIVGLFWYPIGVGVGYVFYELPARVAPVLGIAVSSICGALVIVGLSIAASKPRLAAFWRGAGWAFVGACAGILAAFLPIIVDLSISPGDFYHLMWLQTWI